MSVESEHRESRVPEAPRGWFRYSVRSFLIFTTLVSSLLGWVLKEQSQSSQERRVGEQLQKYGAQLELRGPYDAWQLYESNAPDSWWQRIQSGLFGDRIYQVAIYGEEFVDLTPLAELPNLRQLRLRSSAVKDLTPLSSLTQLQRLQLQSEAVIDLSPLAELNNLQELYLKCPAVKDLSQLTELVNLKKLVLQSAAATDIAELAQLEYVHELDLLDTALSDDQIEALQEKLPNCVIVW